MIKLKDILLEDEVDDTIASMSKNDDESVREVLIDLKNWVEYTTDQKAKDLYAKYDTIKALAKTNPLFKPSKPIGTNVYRGLTQMSFPQPETGQYNFKTYPHNSFDRQIDWSILKKLYNDGKIELGGYVRYPFPITYTPHRVVQSWTVDDSIARSFTSNYYLTTTIDENFYLNEKLMERLYNNEYQGEILHFGKDYTNKVELLVSATYVFHHRLAKK